MTLLFRSVSILAVAGIRSSETMDPSNLPKSEQTAGVPSPHPPFGAWPDAWISIAIGIFLLFWQPRFLQWTSSRIFHTAFNEFLDPSGNVVPYQTLPQFWSDLGPTLFGIVLIVDGLLIFARKRALVWIALILTVAASGFNLCWFIGSYSKYGFAPISALAVIFGVYIASSQWRMLR
jgi:hypothetical protein